jgi:hypothetical protein
MAVAHDARSPLATGCTARVSSIQIHSSNWRGSEAWK